MVGPGLLALLLAASAGVNADAGVTMFPYGSLSDLGLVKACELSLYTSIDCDPSVSSLSTDTYVDSFDNATETSLLCTSTCEASLASLHNTVSASCGTAEFVPGMPFLALVDQVWSNWNQTCFTDPTTGDNCNDVIAAFPDVNQTTDLPTADLCSYCNLQSLSLLQGSAYSNAYTSDWESTYEAVAKICNLTITSFDGAPSAFNVTVPTEEVNCVSGNTYTTKAGDTCDSIAQTYGVSAATMYYINPQIANCSSVWVGVSLCLPQTCTDLYTVQANDTCSSIAADYGLLTADVLNFNSQLNVNCSNLVDPSPYWGSTLCVSTPGGIYTGQALNTTTGPPTIVNPPAGHPVAPGTTTDCGAWFVNDPSANLTCAQICLSNLIAINLFTAANPSLNKTTCDADLVANDAYCVNPLIGWDYTNSTSTNATTTTTVPAATTPGAPTQTGIAADCNKYYTAQSGDTCDTVVAGFGITKAQFLAWNPAVSSDCTTGFWANEAYCVGTVSSGASSTTTSKSTTTTTTTITVTSVTSVTAPGPTQTGIPANCNKYYIVQSGDTCATVEAKYGITDAQFHAWNPAVSSDCTTNFWAEEAYCVGVSGSSSATTATTTTTTTTGTSTSVCIAGTGTGNYIGLCSFCCNYGYCPPGPCTCTAYGAPVPPPPTTGVNGIPLANEDDSYAGLCSFACNHGYCPSAACQVA